MDAMSKDIGFAVIGAGNRSIKVVRHQHRNRNTKGVGDGA